MTKKTAPTKWWISPKGWLGVLLLSTISTGLWDFFLRDALIRGYGYIASIIGATSHTYLDELHEGIGRGYLEGQGIVFSFLVFLIVMANVVGLRLVFYFASRCMSCWKETCRYFRAYQISECCH